MINQGFNSQSTGPRHPALQVKNQAKIHNEIAGLLGCPYSAGIGTLST